MGVETSKLLDTVKKEGIVVFQNEDATGSKRQVQLQTGQEAYFALLAQDMLALAAKYKKDVDYLHKIYFNLCCDREKLIKLLAGEKVDTWSILEDLAVKDVDTSDQYKHVKEMKGEPEVLRRRQFLEI
jgi:hypothetical protein